jgi:hypothetical protein
MAAEILPAEDFRESPRAVAKQRAEPGGNNDFKKLVRRAFRYSKASEGVRIVSGDKVFSGRHADGRIDMPKLYVALAHHPVVNKNGAEIASALTNLDLHDISRSARTYGISAFYVTTPLEDQKQLAKRIVAHWTTGYGAAANPLRRDALELIRIKTSLGEAAEEIKFLEGEYPKQVVTCARRFDTGIDYRTLQGLLAAGRPYLLVFGTAWGLTDRLLREADYILNPIVGRTDYNHLSVRSAVAITLDRLLGRDIC